MDTDDILYTAGADYEPDQIAFTFTNGITDDAGVDLTIEFDIVNPPVA